MFASVHGGKEVLNINVDLFQGLKGSAVNTRIEKIDIIERLTADELADSIKQSIKDHVSSEMTYTTLCHILKMAYGVSGDLCKEIINLLSQKLNIKIIEDSLHENAGNQRVKETYFFTPVNNSDEIYEVGIDLSIDPIEDKRAAYDTLIEGIYIKGKLTADELADSIQPSIMFYIASGMTFKNLCNVLKRIYGVAGSLCKIMVPLLIKRLRLYTTPDKHIYIRSP